MSQVKKRLITKEQQQQVIDLARRGMVRSEITQQTGLSRDIIETICRKHCIRITLAKRGRKKDELRIRAIAALLTFIPGQRQLARHLGCGQATIWRNIEQAKLLPPLTPET